MHEPREWAIVLETGEIDAWPLSRILIGPPIGAEVVHTWRPVRIVKPTSAEITKHKRCYKRWHKGHSQ
jgi:hypothetical protein